MKNLIIHGKPTEERYNNSELKKPHEANWLPWLQSELGARGISTAIPQMPRPYFPVYEDWKDEFEKKFEDSDTGLVGHSAGADFILHWLSENPDATPAYIGLVAPWRDSKGKYGDFSDYTLDPSIPDRSLNGLTIYNSLDDSEAIQQNAQSLVAKMPLARLVQLEGYGHFMLGNAMKDEKFEVLRDEIVARTQE